MRKLLGVIAVAVVMVNVKITLAQIDPEKRQLIQLGYDQPLVGHSPVSGYAFYLWNAPDFPQTNMTLRVAVAPIYLDSELGFRHLLGDNTDFAIGVAGGGFADSYFEYNRGKWEKGQSFTGHGGEVSASVYHLFDPGKLIPLNGVFRVTPHYSLYERDSETANNFVLPRDHASIDVRTGFRLGGQEPTISSDVAMELSVWYEGQFRIPGGNYGFNADREVERASHLFWARALMVYTLPELKHNFGMSFTLGTSIDADRFSAYRIGGHLPLTSEFPLMLPGYYYQELSARNFGLLSSFYTIPFGPHKRWRVTGFASGSRMAYVSGLEQPGHWHAGVGAGIGYRSSSGTWQVIAGYGYGFEAMRDDHHGGHSVSILCQFDLEAHHHPHEPAFEIESPYKSRGLFKLFEE